MLGKNSMKTVSGVPIQTLNPKTIQTLCQLQSTLGWAVPAWAILQTAKFQVPATLFPSLTMTINARAKDKREAVVAGSKKAWSNPDPGSGPMRTGLGTHHWKPETAELEGSLAVRSLLKEIMSRTLMFTKEFPYHLNTFFVVWKPAFSLTCYVHTFTHICTHGILYPSEKNSFPFVNLVNFHLPFKILMKCFLTESSEALRQTRGSLLICTKYRLLFLSSSWWDPGVQSGLETTADPAL